MVNKQFLAVTWQKLGRLFQMLEVLGTKIEKDQLLHKYKNHELYGVPFEDWTPLTKKLLKALPFSLTPSQPNAVSEIIYDLKRPVPMNRLLQITDLLPGRTPIKTFVLEGNEAGFENVFKMMQDELMGGGKVYLVYPVIAESEQLPQLRAATAELKSISERFKMYQCGLLHGRMKSEEKDEALKKFRSGETQILLATQVIEIGVDVPDASMMVVMNAERFGIAQLHQLRGRVGRGERDSKCVFFSSTSSTLDRLKVLEKSSDGFCLANADLLLRGPGNLLGKKQSGHLPEFPIARLEIDGNILQEAHLAAMKVLAASNDLAKFPGLKAELSMRQPLCLLGD